MDLSIFEGFPELKYGISEKKDGFMNINISDDAARQNVAELNRERFLKSRGIEGMVFIPNLVHGNAVKIIDGKNYGERISADGFISGVRNLFLTVTVADCFPLYFYDPVQRAVGIAHAGWRGVGKNIVRNILRAFTNSFGSRPEDIRLGIGPGIRQCHFIVHRDKISALMPREPEAVPGLLAYKSFAKELGGGELAIDLEGIIRHQAESEGVRRIESSGVCAYCAENTHFSYRRDGSPLKVMLAYIGQR